MMGGQSLGAEITKETVDIEDPTPYDLAVDTLIQSRQALAAELAALIDSGASPEEIKAWHLRHADTLEELTQLASDISADQTSARIEYITEAPLPESASKPLETLLIAQAEAFNDHVDLQETPEAFLDEALETLSERAATSKAQSSELITEIAGEAPAVISHIPETANIPDDASPELRALLTERHAQMREALVRLNESRAQGAVKTPTATPSPSSK
jgi:hypothetical protein